ncbi:unnamed protein product [Pleuronectes platessa]|uniref:Uncharacterized protein n=1 Tax=Pleuronectes platessa TaxID=8262 RepID=A0A9N7UYM2_PLEPL|nr:unnamed protein product [Pleuronectes platessa]
MQKGLTVAAHPRTMRQYPGLGVRDNSHGLATKQSPALPQQSEGTAVKTYTRRTGRAPVKYLCFSGGGCGLWAPGGGWDELSFLCPRLELHRWLTLSSSRLNPADSRPSGTECPGTFLSPSPGWRKRRQRLLAVC